MLLSMFIFEYNSLELIEHANGNMDFSLRNPEIARDPQKGYRYPVDEEKTQPWQHWSETVASCLARICACNFRAMSNGGVKSTFPWQPVVFIMAVRTAHARTTPVSSGGSSL